MGHLLGRVPRYFISCIHLIVLHVYFLQLVDWGVDHIIRALDSIPEIEHDFFATSFLFSLSFLLTFTFLLTRSHSIHCSFIKRAFFAIGDLVVKVLVNFLYFDKFLKRGDCTFNFRSHHTVNLNSDILLCEDRDSILDRDPRQEFLAGLTTSWHTDNISSISYLGDFFFICLDLYICNLIRPEFLYHLWRIRVSVWWNDISIPYPFIQV